MNIYYLTYEDIGFGGRSIELIKVLSLIGNVKGLALGINKPNFAKNLSLIDPKTSFFSFIRFATKHYKKNKKDVDIVFIDNRKAALVLWLLGRRIGKKKIVYDMRELRIPSEIKKISSKIGCIPERSIIKKSDLVICANEERAEYVRDNYKVKDVTNFENIRMLEYGKDVDLEFFKNKYKHIFEKESFKLITTSGTTVSRGNDKLVEAVSKVNSPIDILLVGGEFGEKGGDAAILDIVKKNNMTNVHLVGSVKTSELKYLVSNCDCGVVNYHSNDTNNRLCASGKIFEFIFEGKPVITTSNPPLKNFVEKYDIGCSDENYLESINNVLHSYDDYKKNVEKLRDSLSVDENNKTLANYIKKSLNL